MSSQSSGSGRRRINLQQYSAEDDALNLISKEAEDRLAAKRAARSEAREIRMKEIEKQLNESDSLNEHTNESAADKVQQSSKSNLRCDSVDSNDPETKDIDLKIELKELEMKYRAAMINSAQLDNEKQSLVYQVELFKDQLEEQEEIHTELQRDYKEKCRQYDFQKRDLKNMEQEMNILKQQMEIKDKLIAESGFVILTNDNGEPVLQRSSQISSSNGTSTSSLLVSTDVRDFLRNAEGATLGTAVADINTNNSGVNSQVVEQTNCLVTSNIVDAVDGLTLDTVLQSSGDNSGSNEMSALHSSNIDSDVLHDSNVLTARESMSCEHELSRNELMEGGTGAGSDNDSIDNENEDADEFYDAISTLSPSSKVSTFDEQQVSSQLILTDANEGTSVDPEICTEENRLDKPLAHSYASEDRGSILVENVTETESSTDIADVNEDNNIKDSIQEADSSTYITDENDENSRNRLDKPLAHSYASEDGGSIHVENVTETESSTDIADVNEENNIKDSIQEAENSTYITDENEENSSKDNIQKIEKNKDMTDEHDSNNGSAKKTESIEITYENDDIKDHVEEIESNTTVLEHKEECDIEDCSNGAENEKQVDVLETHKPEIIEIETLSNERQTSTESSLEEPSAEKKAEEVDNDETVEKLESQIISKDSETDEKLESQITFQDSENVENLKQDNIEVVQRTEAKETGHTADVAHSDSNESQDISSVDHTEIENDNNNVIDETLQVNSTGNLVCEMNIATEREDIETIEVSAYNLSTESPLTSEEQHTAEKTDYVQSTICEIQDGKSVSDSGESDVPQTTEILYEISAEKHDDDSIVNEKVDAESVEAVQDRLNGESENLEGNNLECKESEVGDTGKKVEHEKGISESEEEESESEQYEGSPVKDSSKMVVRSTSLGGSSDGAGLDDYDLDDIDEILNTGTTSSPSANELHSTPTTKAESTVTETTRSANQEGGNYAQTVSHKDVESKDETKCTDNFSKKNKEKTKTSKKEGKDKVKSSEKDKTEKNKSKSKESKDKSEKSKSTKKDSGQEKKADKSKHGKKELVQEIKAEAVGGEEDKHSLNTSQTSLEPDDLEGALDKQMQESDRRKSPKKSSKKLSIFKKVFK